MKTVTITQSLLESPELDAIEKILYFYFLALADEPQFPDYQHIMKKTGIRSRTTLSKKLKILQAKGLLEVQATYLENGFQSRNHYRVMNKLVAEHTPLEQLFVTTLPKLTKQDYVTFERLCATYPQPVIQFVLESVKGKSKQCNWAYITATLKNLAKTCQTYDECVEQTKQFFAQKAAEAQQLKQATHQKYALIMRFIHLGLFGEITNAPAYAKRVLQDPNHEQCTSYELFEILSGCHHLDAYSYDKQIFDILYPLRPEECT
ncbi:MAG: hypothetical protein ACRC5Q_01670 [Culicoidibacterales bacterium]